MLTKQTHPPTWSDIVIVPKQVQSPPPQTKVLHYVKDLLWLLCVAQLHLYGGGGHMIIRMSSTKSQGCTLFMLFSIWGMNSSIK